MLALPMWRPGRLAALMMDYRCSGSGKPPAALQGASVEAHNQEGNALGPGPNRCSATARIRKRSGFECFLVWDMPRKADPRSSCSANHACAMCEDVGNPFQV